MRAIVLGIALVLGILGFLIFMGGYDIYSNPLRGTSFWESRPYLNYRIPKEKLQMG